MSLRLVPSDGPRLLSALSVVVLALALTGLVRGFGASRRPPSVPDWRPSSSSPVARSPEAVGCPSRFRSPSRSSAGGSPSDRAAPAGAVFPEPWPRPPWRRQSWPRDRPGDVVAAAAAPCRVLAGTGGRAHLADRRGGSRGRCRGRLAGGQRGPRGALGSAGDVHAGVRGRELSHPGPGQLAVLHRHRPGADPGGLRVHHRAVGGCRTAIRAGPAGARCPAPAGPRPRWSASSSACRRCAGRRPTTTGGRWSSGCCRLQRIGLDVLLTRLRRPDHRALPVAVAGAPAAPGRSWDVARPIEPRGPARGDAEAYAQEVAASRTPSRRPVRSSSGAWPARSTWCPSRPPAGAMLHLYALSLPGYTDANRFEAVCRMLAERPPIIVEEYPDLDLEPGAPTPAGSTRPGSNRSAGSSRDWRETATFGRTRILVPWPDPSSTRLRAGPLRDRTDQVGIRRRGHPSLIRRIAAPSSPSVANPPSCRPSQATTGMNRGGMSSRL